jgi:hypothetical protein
MEWSRLIIRPPSLAYLDKPWFLLNNYLSVITTMLSIKILYDNKAKESPLCRRRTLLLSPPTQDRTLNSSISLYKASRSLPSNPFLPFPALCSAVLHGGGRCTVQTYYCTASKLLLSDRLVCLFFGLALPVAQPPLDKFISKKKDALAWVGMERLPLDKPYPR